MSRENQLVCDFVDSFWQSNAQEHRKGLKPPQSCFSKHSLENDTIIYVWKMVPLTALLAYLIRVKANTQKANSLKNSTFKNEMRKDFEFNISKLTKIQFNRPKFKFDISEQFRMCIALGSCFPVIPPFMCLSSGFSYCRFRFLHFLSMPISGCRYCSTAKVFGWHTLAKYLHWRIKKKEFKLKRKLLLWPPRNNVESESNSNKLMLGFSLHPL